MSENLQKDTDQGNILLIDKPREWTSFDIIRKIRRILKVKKAGHAGTLDPLATGLLIVCTGKKTKEISHFQNLKKEYEGTFTLGEIRPSCDLETEIEEKRDIAGITPEKILKAAELFQGSIQQVPPAYSAIKKAGKRMYRLARMGEKVELSPRKVRIYAFEITAIELPEVHFRLVSSKGFYVRSLARDFGEILGCGASLSALRRTRIGEYRIEDAWKINELTPDKSK